MQALSRGGQLPNTSMRANMQANMQANMLANMLDVKE